MDIQNFIERWIAVSNAFDADRYFDFYLNEAILDDRSVGATFRGRLRIKEYFESYFIGYNTLSEIVSLQIHNEDEAHLEVQFTGDFPEGRIGGTFDFKFKNDKITRVKADLIRK